MADFLSRLFRRIPIGETDGSGAPGTASILVHWLDVTPVDSKDKPCVLRTLDVDARVRGVFSEVTQTIEIYNPNPRPLSTSVSIPLPDRATVCGYALDISGQMVDGVVVPKDKARVVFEEEQRRGADPGLVEVVRGNAYRTRVYPVPPNGKRTVRLRYVAPLLIGADGSATLDLPMPAEHLDRRTIKVAVERLDATTPEVSGLAGAQVRLTGLDWGINTDESDLTPTEPVRVTLPALPKSLAVLERDKDGDVWFCASDVAPEPTTDDVPSLASLTVLWDASGSRAGHDHTRELELLRAYASAESIRSITLVVFADHVREVTSLASADELCARIADVRYDGGTNLSALTSEVSRLDGSLTSARQGGACVLFTDGLDTLCDEVFSMPDGRDVAAIVSGDERDVEAMRQGCKGLAFEISQAPKDARELMRELCNGGRLGLWRVGGTGIADACDSSAPGSGRRIAIGRLTGNEAQLSLGEGTEPLTLRAEDARDGCMLASAWASRRVALLAPRADENAEELLRLGRRFGVTSPATSLIVLETLDQWLRHDIEPPLTLTDMHERWTRAQAGKMQLSSEASNREQHRNRLAGAWRSYLSWWQEDHTKPSRDDDIASVLGGIRSMSLSTSPRNLFSDAEEDSLGDFMPESALPTMAMPASAPSNRSRQSMARESGSSPSMARAMRARSSGGSDGDGGDTGAQPSPAMSVAVKAWMPNAPYLKALDEAASTTDPLKARDAYFGQRGSYVTSPSFFLDCACWFMAHGDEDFGVSVLTNLAELRIEDAGLLRVMAWRLRESGRLEQALVTLRRVLRLRKEDSQSHRDLALVLTELARMAYDQGDEDAALRHVTEAGEFLRTTALTPWKRRAMAIGLFAVEEYNVLRAWAAGKEWATAPELPSLGEDLEGVPDCDLRITLAWDADETDVDIHVTEPSGEEAYYAHRITSSGGRVSEDITDGFGPEQYEIRKALPGTYVIRAHYYASHQQTVFGPATCTLTVYTDWGRSNQAQTITTTRLDRAHQMTEVGTASYGFDACEDAKANEGGGAADLPAEHRVEVGMSESQVFEILGEPRRSDSLDNASVFEWGRPGGRKLIVFFVDGSVLRVIESMPWGEESIIAQ